jgi:hypothetical protein
VDDKAEKPKKKKKKEDKGNIKKEDLTVMS